MSSASTTLDAPAQGSFLSDEDRSRPGRPPARDVAAAAWRLCAPAMAARGRVRLWNRRVHGYPQRDDAPVTEHLPLDPAAVHVYDHAGTTRWLFGDFDVKLAMRRGALRPQAAYEQVARDAEDLAQLITACGGRSFADRSPVSGGRHLYVPWAAAVPFEDMRRLGIALARRYPSFDHLPLMGRINGLIRPPGSRHPRGGYQTLTTAPHYVHRAITAPNGPHVWERLITALEPELAEAERPGAPSINAWWNRPSAPTAADDSDDHGARRTAEVPHKRVDPAGMPWLPKASGRRPALSPILEAVARTGQYNTGCYGSDSEARQAVLTSAAATGWQLADVVDQLHAGNWPGLQGLYARYGNDRTRAKALRSDWDNAVAWLAGERTGRRIHTCGNAHRGGNGGADCEVPQDHQWRAPVHCKLDLEIGSLQQIRRWWAAMEIICRGRWRGETAITRRRILYAIVAAAQMAHSMVIDWGTRELGILAGGLDHSTVAKHLKAMRKENDPVIDLLGRLRGKRGDLYALIIPESARELAAWRRWPPGKLGGIHIVFSEIGGAAAFIYEQLSTEGTNTVDLQYLTGLARSTVKKALAAMAEHGMAEKGDDGWRRGPIGPDTVATQLGLDSRIPQLRARYQSERLLWWAYLEGHLPEPPDHIEPDSIPVEPSASQRAVGAQVQRPPRKRRGIPRKVARGKHPDLGPRPTPKAGAPVHGGPTWVDPHAELIPPATGKEGLTPSDLQALSEETLTVSPALKRRYLSDPPPPHDRTSRPGDRRQHKNPIKETRTALRILSQVLGKVTVLHEQDPRPP